MSVEAAIQELDTANLGDSISYKLAGKHSVYRSTLTPRAKGTHASRQDDALERRLLHLRDEAELVDYTKGLTERHRMPTRQIKTRHGVRQGMSRLRA
jgi:hypothetical protein